MAFRAMGQMVYILKDRMDLDPVLSTIKNNLRWSESKRTHSFYNIDARRNWDTPPLKRRLLESKGAYRFYYCLIIISYHVSPLPPSLLTSNRV